MTLTDKINRMIETALQGARITSANPTHTNFIESVGELDNTENLDSEIREIFEEKGSSQVDSLSETVENLRKSPFGELQSLTAEQVGNLRGFAGDPFTFIFNNIFKRFAKGAGIIALATLIFSAVQFILTELMKPGRFLDRRFRRTARDEILLFNSREEQAELRQGFRTVTVTTLPFLRGSEVRGQISGNLYNPTAIPMNRIDPRRVAIPQATSQNSSRAAKFFNRRNR